MGILIDPGCVKVTCTNGCGVWYMFLIFLYKSMKNINLLIILQYVFCVKCLQGFHIGECGSSEGNENQNESCQYNVDPTRVEQVDIHLKYDEM